MSEENKHLHKNYDEIYNICLEQQKEIERLNNIINNIDTYANKLRYYADEDNESYKISKDIHNIIQELKGSISNEQ